MTINPALKSYLDFLLAQRKEKREYVKTLRRYADGEQAAQLTDDQRVLLVGEDGKDPEFALNICGTVLNVEVDRLSLREIKVTVPEEANGPKGGPKPQSEKLSQLIAEWRDNSDMDEVDSSTFWAACRDADSFFIAEYDPEQGPCLVLNEAYDGDTGVEIAYEDGNPNKPLYATKRWDMQRPVVGNAKQNRVRRMNIYFDNRIEYWIDRGRVEGTFREAGWEPYQEVNDGDETLSPVVMTQQVDAYGNSYMAAVTWLTHDSTETGIPLGMPVFHFRHDARGGMYGRSSIADLVPGVQDAVNLSSVSLVAAALLSGFKVITVTGMEDSAAALLKLFPATVLSAEDPAAAFGQLAESNLMQLIEVVNTQIKQAAMLTSTPLSFFNVSGQVMAEGTLQQTESGLLAKLGRDQRSFGSTYKRAARYLLKLDVAYNEASTINIGGSVEATLAALNKVHIACQWEPAQVRNETEVITQGVTKVKDLGIPREVVWQEIGYSPDEVASMTQAAEVKRNQVMGQLAATIRDNEAQNAALKDAQAKQQIATTASANGNGNGNKPTAQQVEDAVNA